MSVKKVGTTARPSVSRTFLRQSPGLAAALFGVAAAWAIHSAVPDVPLLTAAVVLGIIAGNVTGIRQFSDGVLKPGLSLAGKRLMRIGIVLLGLKLSLFDIAGLGWRAVLIVVGIVIISFFGIWYLARLLKLPGHQPLLVAAGFSICGASAIGAMAGVTKSDDKEAVTPVALVTLCGTLAIFVLPPLMVPLGLSDIDFGRWVGAGVHDVGQVVATAQTAGTTALAAAVIVKLTRVLMLAPMVAGTGLALRRTERRAASAAAIAESSAAAAATGTDGAMAERTDGAATTGRPAQRAPNKPAATPIVPLFVLGFLAAVVVRTTGILPDSVLAVADLVQTILLGAALFGLGSAVRIGKLLTTGGRSLAVAGLAWLVIAILAWCGVQLM
ncbi:putative sulfate exporter family transporter [Saxibacter everestensis]|uniref:Sulfate exporter family transporter n=1 Tax=Saxibacter everestensis TaxID=2909229 RepID=A0ABY8QQI4_9MICO|nr:putative sulfate exporter family transporter [Brevibacteriaceae bacterium ZFBP1038]